MNIKKSFSKKLKNLLILSVFIVVVFSIITTIKLQEKNDRIFYNSFGSSLRIFNLMMDDYSKDSEEANNIDEKIKSINELIIRIDRLQLSFGYIEDKFNLSFYPLATHINNIDVNKLKVDSSYYTEAINTLNEVFIISTKIKNMDYNEFYKNHYNKFLRLKPSDKIVDYFDEINNLSL